ncbi:MAG: Tfp pilus assembly protein FimT/FimU [Chthoniobacteraceae bacterium]
MSAPSPFLPFAKKDNGCGSIRAFSLVEILGVMCLIVSMMTLAVPAMNSIGKSSYLTGTAYEISGILDQARAYAIAKNTYVYVGIVEVDASRQPSAKPQVAGKGRVAVVMAASKDGTRGYSISAASIAKPAVNGSNLLTVGKLRYFENVHLADLGEAVPSVGGLARPSIADSCYRLANGYAEENCVTPLRWPVASGADSSQYTFNTVINFDPQGVARIQKASNGDTIPPFMELGIQETRGNVVASGSNCAVIQIDGMTGSNRIYRP